MHVDWAMSGRSVLCCWRLQNFQEFPSLWVLSRRMSTQDHAGPLYSWAQKWYWSVPQTFHIFCSQRRHCLAARNSNHFSFCLPLLSLVFSLYCQMSWEGVVCRFLEWPRFSCFVCPPNGESPVTLLSSHLVSLHLSVFFPFFRPGLSYRSELFCSCLVCLLSCCLCHHSLFQPV